ILKPRLPRRLSAEKWLRSVALQMARQQIQRASNLTPAAFQSILPANLLRTTPCTSPTETWCTELLFFLQVCSKTGLPKPALLHGRSGRAPERNHNETRN